MGARSVSCRREPLTVPATGAVRIPDGGLAPTRSAVATTVANSPWRFAAVARASSSALGPARVEGVRGVQHEEDSKPMSEPARAVVSQQWLVVMPHTAMPSYPCSRSQAARSGDPRNAGCTDFATSGSGSPVMTSLKASHGCQGSAASPAPASRGVRTPVAPHRHAAISSAMLLSHSGLLRGPQLSASSKPCCTSTTTSATWSRSVT